MEIKPCNLLVVVFCFVFYDPYILYPVSNVGFYRGVLRDWLLITIASVRGLHLPKVRAQILVTRGHGNPLGSVRHSMGFSTVESRYLSLTQKTCKLKTPTACFENKMLDFDVLF